MSTEHKLKSGAQWAAAVIMGSESELETTRGVKRLDGVADIIEEVTGLRDLLEACEGLRRLVDNSNINYRSASCVAKWSEAAAKADAAIAYVRREK